jgi:methyl-accepting chemotaxis protein
METIRGSSGAISEITSIINDLSEQTNMLSLNASIEAARAGEYGRGFAVVAEEIGKLADRSIAQARSIQSHVSATVTSIENERRIIENSTDVIENIKKAVDDVNAGIEQIIGLCLQQEEKAGTIDANMNRVSEESDGITVATREQKQIMKEVSESLEHLNTIMYVVMANTSDLLDSVIVLDEQSKSLKELVEKK